MASEDRFGYEWNKYHQLDPKYQKQFENWTGPLTREEFYNKVVLDAGCGMGRNSYWALEYGAKFVTAFDYGKDSVEAAKVNLKKFENVEVFHKSIYEIEWQDKYDIAFSIGVIHHLKEPKKALLNLTQSLKSGGTLLVWVYSYEGNEWIVRFVDPIRKNITSKLPVSMVHIISYFLSAPLWVFVKLFKGPTPYLRMISTFKFWHLHSIVFDQLIPEVANYWSKSDLEKMFNTLNLKSFSIHEPKSKSGWIVIGTK